VHLRNTFPAPLRAFFHAPTRALLFKEKQWLLALVMLRSASPILRSRVACWSPLSAPPGPPATPTLSTRPTCRRATCPPTARPSRPSALPRSSVHGLATRCAPCRLSPPPT